MRFTYYPPGSSPQYPRPYCDEPMGIDYRGVKSRCLLQPDHEGEHNAEANWAAHVEVEPVTLIGKSYGVKVAFRSWHDSRALRVRTREEADALLDFLRSSFDEAFETRSSANASH